MRSRGIFDLVGPLLWLAGLCAALPAADDLAYPPQILAFHGEDQQAAMHALVAISVGEVEAISSLPRSLFHANQAVADPLVTDLSRRWSRCIPLALARCPPGARQSIIAVLDRDCQAELAAHPDQPWLALDFLPAPGARTRLELLAAQAFDHGRFADSLCAAALVAAPDAGGSATTSAAHPSRVAVAALLLGNAAAVDAALALSAPGEPEGAAPMSTQSVGGTTVVWRTQPGWLLACAGDGRTLWQLRLDPDAEVMAGAGAALVHDSSGLRVVTEDGTWQALTPPPGDTRLLCVSGGACWFATGSRAWRLAIGETSPHAIDLGAEPLGAPVVRGLRSLWLLPEELRLYDGTQLIGRMRHHLAVAPGWHLAAHAEPAATVPLILAPDGGCWTIPTLAAQLAGVDQVAHAQLLVAAWRPAEALALLTPETLNSDAGKAVAFAAHCALGPAHLAAQAALAETLATTPDQIATVRLVAYRQASAPAPRAQALLRLLGCLHEHPEVELAWSVDDLAVAPEHWRHVSNGQVLADALERAQAPPPSPVALPALPLLAGVPHPEPSRSDEVVVDHDLGRVHHYGDGLLVLDHASGETTLACHDPQSHALRWRTRWLSSASAPSRSLALVDGYAVVAEGTNHLSVLDAETGRLSMVIDCAGIPAQPTRARVASAQCLVMSGPLDDELAIATAPPAAGFDAPPAQVEAVRVALSGRARWLAPLPAMARVLVQFEDGRTCCYPGAEPVTLPAALATAGAAPQLAPEGLLSAGVLYRWNL